MANNPNYPNPQSDEARKAMLINRAYDLAEKKLMDGTASSQIIAYFLKMGSEREQAEVENIKQQNKLNQAKTKAINDAPKSDQLLQDAMEAMKRYGAHSDV